MNAGFDETGLRIAVFQWLREQESWNNGIFSGRAFNEGITVAGRRVTLKGQTGIWFPAGWTMPVSITTSNKDPTNWMTSARTDSLPTRTGGPTPTTGTTRDFGTP